MLDSIKTFFADEKVQAFAMGAVAGGLIAGGVTYFATRKSSTTVADAVDKTVKAAEATTEAAAEKAADVADDINPKKDEGPTLD